ncbi:MAG TPA: molybdopterin molybdenumtransferase MoeA, partial [Psychrobacter sp.]|nr:molybdopterin molybdenumtransferase MoeA [Psychrobacter sp.]
QNSDGSFTVKAFSKQQSHRIKQLSQANCLIVLAKDSGNLLACEQVEVQPFPWS